MTTDARFEDAADEAPLRLAAETPADVEVLSALVQDSVFPGSEMEYDIRANRFAVLLNRYRWERDEQPPERVQSVLAIDAVTSVRSTGFDRADRNQIFSLLAVGVEEGDPDQKAVLTLAGEAEIVVTLKAISISLQDVTRPYRAPSGQVPAHKVD
ncbi:MAG: DUF2948 family protein [Pseudomonadota bacterium]